jgi:hypothetical protein
MKRPTITTALALIAGLAVSGMASAAELEITDQDVASWAQVGQAMDGCVAGLTLRSDPSVCRGLATWLSTYAGRVAIAAADAKKKPAPQPPPAASSGVGPAGVGGDHPGD